MANEKTGNWFSNHKVLTIILAIVLFGIIGSIAGGGDTKKETTGTEKTKEYRFTDRADKQPTDSELLPNEAATVDGVKMTLASVKYSETLSEFEKASEGSTYLVADVRLENTSQSTKPYNAFDFRVQTASGQVLDSSYAMLTNPLNSGDLVAGGYVNGQIVFTLPVEDAHQYVIWKPSWSPERAVVQVK